MLVVSRYLIFLSLGAALLAQSPSLSIAPPVITECVAGRGSARLLGNSLGPGLVQVRIGDAQGPAMTGREAPAGSAQTGGWVSNGLVFVLVADARAELARVTAKVICDATPDPLEGALAVGAWFPLQVGNQWVYRYDSRFLTSAYTTWTITGVEQRKDRTYFVLSSIPGAGPSDNMLRSDGEGRIYRIRDTAPQTEELWLDPTASPDPSAVLKIRQRDLIYKSALGTFSGGIVSDTSPGLIKETGTFVRGLGLVERRVSLQSGSSGGFSDGLQLVSVRFGKGIRLAVPAITFQFGAESTRLDVTNKNVTNCAVPCFFAACGIGGGGDPPNTYKPCFQALLNIQRPNVDGGVLTAEVELRDPADRQVFQATVPLTMADVLTDFTAFQQVPLYAKPNEPFAAGDYRLNGRLKRNGEDAGSTSLPIRID